jgi:hypothetical protein
MEQLFLLYSHAWRFSAHNGINAVVFIVIPVQSFINTYGYEY